MTNYNTKYEFLAALEKELEHFGIVDKDDILADFEQHFADSRKQGYTDSEICERLGSITEIAKQYASEVAYSTQPVEPENASETAQPSQPAQEKTVENDDGSINYVKDFTSGFSDVRINVIVAKTTIACSPDGTARVRYTNNRPGMRFSAELIGNTLEISEKSRGFSFWLFSFTNHHSELYVELPRRIYNSINFGTISGGAEALGLRANYLILNTTSGTVNIKAHADEIDLSTVSANITLENCTDLPSKNIKVNSTSGHANIYGFKPRNYSFTAVSGHLDITGLTGEGRVNLTSGHAKLQFDEWNSGLNISIVSGWVDVKLPEDSGVNLNMSKVSGYVKYDLGSETGRCGKNGQYSFGGSNRQNANVSLTSGHVGFSY